MSKDLSAERRGKPMECLRQETADVECRAEYLAALIKISKTALWE